MFAHCYLDFRSTDLKYLRLSIYLKSKYFGGNRWMSASHSTNKSCLMECLAIHIVCEMRCMWNVLEMDVFIVSGPG